MINEIFYEKYKDVYFIYKNIKKINKSYVLVRNKLKNIFEIRNKDRNYELCFSFKDFNIDVIRELNKTRIENMITLEKEIEQNNEKIKQDKINKTIEKMIKTKENLIG